MDREICLLIPGEAFESHLNGTVNPMFDKTTGHLLRTERSYLADMNTR
jgi:hypothetical protein